jgi:hypothetical protein
VLAIPRQRTCQPTHCNQNILLSVSSTTMLVVFHHFACGVQLYTISACLHTSHNESYDIVKFNTTNKQIVRVLRSLSCLCGSKMCFEQRLCCNLSTVRHLCAIYAHISTVYWHKHSIFVYAPSRILPHKVLAESGLYAHELRTCA